MGSPTGAPGGGWRVGGQPWDGPLALPGKGGVSGAGAGGGLAWGRGGAGPAFSPAPFLLGVGGVGAAKGLLFCFLVPKGNQPTACTLALWWLKFGPTSGIGVPGFHLRVGGGVDRARKNWGRGGLGKRA